MKHLPALTALLFATAAAATPPLPPPPPPKGPELAAIIQSVSGQRMRQDVERLVSFGTRHTLSSQTDPRRGIGAALNWTEAQFKSFGLQTVRPCDMVTGRRVPTPTRVCDMVAIQRGTERPNDVVIITGHIDSRVSDVMNATADAPGANDDGSGTAAVIEAARVLAKQKFAGTIVYAALSGEEQGLLGGKVLADYAKAQGWNVVANLNNDIIGNSCGSDRVCNDRQVRVFSEGPRWQGHEALAARIRSLGGENDAPSRNISRFLDDLAGHVPAGIDVVQIWRNDRFGRGGDHTEFLNSGFPAVRLSVAVEDYEHQHQDLRTDKGIKYGDTVDEMDFAYLERVTKLNVAALAAIANAPPPPDAAAEGAVSTDTIVRWNPVAGARGYVVRWRATDASQWGGAQYIPVGAGDGNGCLTVPAKEDSPNLRCGLTLPGVRVDDYVFGVASVSANGWVSPVASAVPGGAFKPYSAPVEGQ
ncbi:M20/M25/M40 family metallo-hydrolase [Sphingomonas sabuli]|uniref:M20/M25/M40 family metallo-hydrolase n=1 Tax=Sphingomonas sabuli TaxID=2764186 RepID=A0A7G9L544_9SPHN|nr:M28 family peptidase [Sphingomonas sabuli]QNM83743.1 M20/M25/M40 family metallo-hydrolase [Sphingomonas sabuli]